MTEDEFISTFVGECQHLGYRIMLRDDNRLYYECLMWFEHPVGTLHRCSSARPLTANEIVAEARKTPGRYYPRSRGR